MSRPDCNLYRVTRPRKPETTILIWEAKELSLPEGITIIGHFKTQEAYLKAVVDYKNRDGVFLHFGVMPYVKRTCPHCLQTFKTEKMVKLHEPLCPKGSKEEDAIILRDQGRHPPERILNRN